MRQRKRPVLEDSEAVLVGLRRDERTSTQVLSDAGAEVGGFFRIRLESQKSCFEAALLVQARRRELIRAARSAGTAHSECELLRRHSGHVRQIGPNLAKRAGRRIAARSSYWRSDSTRSQRRAAHSESEPQRCQNHGHLVDDRRDDDRQPAHNTKKGPLVAAEP